MEQPNEPRQVQKSKREEPPHYQGHRERLRAKFRKFGGQSLEGYELLELVLFRALPRRDTKPIAKALIRRFGSFSEAVAAPAARLRELDGVGENVITELKIVEAAAQLYARGQVAEKRILSSWSAVMDYCRTAMGFAEKEQFRILFLDKRNGLIADELQQSGTVDHTPVYPREVVKRALELSASAIVLAHNHPSGDPTPSRADIDMTNRIIDIADQLGIAVHDHIIVGRNGHASLRALGLLGNRRLAGSQIGTVAEDSDLSFQILSGSWDGEKT